MRPLTEIEAQIADAMRVASDNCYRLEPRAWWSKARLACCALGSVDIGPDRSVYSVQEALGIDAIVTGDIALGFDADPSTAARVFYGEAFNVGARLRLLAIELNAALDERQARQ